MRARPREINIFNMSLLDILCGALGAFCFMMLVALPYYTGPGNNPQLMKNRQATEEMLAELERLRSQMTDPAAAEELQKLMQRLTGQLKQLEGQLNQVSYENEQLKKDKQDLQAKNDTRERWLLQQKPFLLISDTEDVSQSVDLFLQDDLTTAKGDKSVNGVFDPAGEQHTSGWEKDITGVALPYRGVTVWVSGTTISQANFKIYVRYGREVQPRKATMVYTTAFGDFVGGRRLDLPNVVLSPQRFWTLLGRFAVDENYKIAFKEATPAERDEEWKAIMKNEPPPQPTPPPAVPAVTVAPSAAPAATIDFAELERRRKEIAERMQRERERQQLVSPSPGVSPSAAPRVSEEEMRVLRERARLRGQTSPAPTQPAPSP